MQPFHPQLSEPLEIPLGPPRVGIKRSELPPLQPLAIIHIPQFHVGYHQHPASMLANSRNPIQAGLLFLLCCFLHLNIVIYPANLSDNIMLDEQKNVKKGQHNGEKQKG